MPYHIEKRGNRFSVVADDTGNVAGTHDTEERAKRQLKALYANVPEARNKDMTVEFNRDIAPIAQWEDTPEGYLYLWIATGVANKDLIYEDGRKEFITLDNLWNKKTKNTAVGKPLTRNHPNVAVDGSNIRTFSYGTALQETKKDDKTGTVYHAAIVHDAEMVKMIKEGKITHASSGYKSNKKLNQDGRIEQLDRDYNHFGLIEFPYVPRAGENSNIIQGDAVYKQNEQDNSFTKIVSTETNNDSGNEKSQPQTTTNTTELTSIAPNSNRQSNPITSIPPNSNRQSNSDNQGLDWSRFQHQSNSRSQPNVTTTQNNQLDIQAQLDAQQRDFALRASIIKDWGSFIEDKGYQVDYNLDSRGLKQQVLAATGLYDLNILKQLTTDALLDGFWLNFLAKDAKEVKQQIDTANSVNPHDVNRLFPQFQNPTLSALQGDNARVPTEAELINHFNNHIGAQ